MRIFIIISLSFVLFTASLSLAVAQDPASNELKKQLIIKTTSNKVFDLSQKKGKVVIISFWASWCTICRVEMNNLNDLYLKYQDQGLEIIGLNIDGKLSWGKNFKYPIAFINSYTIGNFVTPRTIPFVYIINKDGVVIHQLNKPDQIKIENIKNIVEPLLVVPKAVEEPNVPTVVEVLDKIGVVNKDLPQQNFPSQTIPAQNFPGEKIPERKPLVEKKVYKVPANNSVKKISVDEKGNMEQKPIVIKKVKFSFKKGE